MSGKQKDDDDDYVAVEGADGMIRLPDGSGAFVASFPLPKTHWIFVEGRSEPPMPFMIDSWKRNQYADQIKAAARHAIRASTMNGREMDFDPDAMVQNMIVALIGPWPATARPKE